jgi:hypothetical protein
MMIKLNWSALILAALAAVACRNSGDEPACDESRPVFGARACCQRHSVAGKTAIATVAELEAARRASVSPIGQP